MKIRAASLALFYVMSPVSVRLEERRWSLGAAEIVTKQGDELTNGWLYDMGRRANQTFRSGRGRVWV